jgi:hypothetical protein
MGVFDNNTALRILYVDTKRGGSGIGNGAAVRESSVETSACRNCVEDTR